MTQERQHKIDALHGYTKRILEVSLSILFALMFTVLIPPLLNKFGWDITTYTWYSVVALIYKYSAAGLGIVAVLSIASVLILSIWATDDEREQAKADMKEIMQEIKTEEASKPKRTIFSPDEVKIPLKGLTPEQISAVHKLLQSIPEQNGHLKTSDLVQFLRALKGQGDLDDSDMQRVIVWVEYVTEKAVDERNFKYDYDNKYSEKGVVKWGNKIREKYDKIEIS